MLQRIWPADPFERSVAVFFALIVLVLALATVVNAPLAYDGAFYLFRVLDSQRFFAAHLRLINVPLQLPTLMAQRLTNDLDVLRLTFCASYALMPALALAVSWFVCKSRRPSLFIWPAMSICIAGLPGQIFLSSETIMAVTLLWPALVTVLVGAPAAVLPWVALTSIGAASSHPYAGLVLALVVMIAIISAIVRPESRKQSIGIALGLSVLLLARVLAPLDSYETGAASLQTIIWTFKHSVMGWPLIAIALTMVGALSCLVCSGSRARAYLNAPLALAGLALVVWAIRPANWAPCLDYRYWVMPVSLPLMTAAAIEELWLRRSEPQLQEIRRQSLSLIGAMFFLVLSIQSVQWGIGSHRLANELMSSGRGCIPRQAVTSVKNTALDFWSLGAYAVELQGRRPSTLVLAHKFACRVFAFNGDAILVDIGTFSYLRHRGRGWFDFEEARSRTDQTGKWLAPNQGHGSLDEMHQ